MYSFSYLEPVCCSMNYLYKQNALLIHISLLFQSLFPYCVVQLPTDVWLFGTHGLQLTRLPCPSLAPGVCSNAYPLSWWCHPTISLLFPFEVITGYWGGSLCCTVSSCWLSVLCIICMCWSHTPNASPSPSPFLNLQVYVCFINKFISILF